MLDAATATQPSKIDDASPEEIERMLVARLGTEPQRQGAPAGQGHRLGDRLVQAGLVSLDDLEIALAGQRERGARLGEMLVEMGVLSPTALAQVLAEHLGLTFVDFTKAAPDPTLAGLIPEGFARRYQAIAVERSAVGLVVAMADPHDILALDDLRVLVREPVVPVLGAADQLAAAIDRAYQGLTIESQIDDAADNVEPEYESAAEDITVSDGPLVRLVNAMFEKAIADRASDIHIEPGQGCVRIRTRIDGVLHDTSEAPLSMLRSLIVRLKVLGGLDIANSRVPQDGRFSVSAQGRAVDVRVATLPTAAGEAAVLRILDSKSEVAFSSLGLTEYETNRLLPHLHARQGAIVVTGPTGAGKTTTLYSMLREMNSREKSIMSIEDPVEYVMDGIKQIQVNNRANMGFAPALRSVLRSDPDVILVGEMRDAETARIAASASITGHLVLTSLHTTSAAATAMRLADMGVEPYMVASALTCVVSQRLARRLCEHCARPLLDADLSVLLELGAPESLLEGATLRTPVGCPACRETGYSGRRSIFEIMPVTEEIRRVIVERGSVADVERIAVEQGMDTLRVAALRRVVTGELSIDEMMRCAG